MNACKNCSATLNADEAFCTACGSLIVTREENLMELECERHPERTAVGLCVICGMPVCSDCEVKRDGKILCPNPGHNLLLQDWCVIRQMDSEFEADAFVRNLADGGVEAQSFSLHDHCATHWLKENRVLLFVRKSEHEKARVLLKELNLLRME
jgi:RNA polymerase subunit RPABC4/transcription elongation factor Spt4